jgi:Ca2+-binding EF-hand superfamily protein
MEKSGVGITASLIKNVKIDKSLDKLLKEFCIAIRKETAGKTPDDIFRYYANDTPGYLNYQEFHNVVMNYYVDLIKDEDAKPNERKIHALFDLFDTYYANKVKSDDFNLIINNNKPISTVVHRICNKIKRGGARFLRELTEEF